MDLLGPTPGDYRWQAQEGLEFDAQSFALSTRPTRLFGEQSWRSEVRTTLGMCIPMVRYGLMHQTMVGAPQCCAVSFQWPGRRGVSGSHCRPTPHQRTLVARGVDSR